ncbi:MAG TPA: hypothetical protein VEJ47_13265 [Candidatus Eremiobacteraceae bacterium]|nr:hypothetical protein [Candidatus Eremiobacteraceae bacterium]
MATRRIKPFSRAFELALLLLAIASFSQAQSPIPVVHVFVALADNQHQGIVPVPPRLGNGHDLSNNLYWGAAYGVKTFFQASRDWKLVTCATKPQTAVLERCVFRHKQPDALLIADAYDGAKIRDAVSDFVSSAAALRKDSVSIRLDDKAVPIALAGDADLLAYVGHDAFMDFQIPAVRGKSGAHPRQFVVLACASKLYFAPYMRNTESEPLLWTTGLMAPEAYTLKAALDGWIRSEPAAAIRQRAAVAYSKYQKCSLQAAQRLLVTGW